MFSLLYVANELGYRTLLHPFHLQKVVQTNSAMAHGKEVDARVDRIPNVALKCSVFVLTH